GCRPRFGPRVLAPLHDAQPGVRRIHEVGVRALGVRLRSQPATSELGRQDDVAAASAADVVSSIRASPRRRPARTRRLLWAGAYGARVDAVGPLVGVARGAVSISPTEVAGSLVGGQPRRAARAGDVWNASCTHKHDLLG